MSLIVNGNIIINFGHQMQPQSSASQAEAAKYVRLDDTIKGKRQPWRQKKTKTMPLADALHELGHNKKANRVWWCGAELVYDNEPCEGGRLISAGFCRERLCVMCAWRKSIRVFYHLSNVLDVAQDERPDLETIFLTLTVKNAPGGHLPALVDNMVKGWARLSEHRRWRQSVVGYFRAMEITYNEKDNTYHPHFHAILLVDKPYFFDPKRYLHTTDWVQLWRTSARLDYDPVVDVRAVKTNKGRKRAAVAEVAKYTVKESDIIHADRERTVRVVEALGAALAGRRLYAFGGLMKVIARRMKVDKPDEGDLVNITGEDTMREDVAQALVAYAWDFGARDYFRRV